MPRLLMAFTLLLVALSGCVEDAPRETNADPQEDPTPSTTGSTTGTTTPNRTPPSAGFTGIRGTVFDNNLRAIPEIPIVVLETQDEATSGTDGTFELQLAPGNYTLQVNTTEYRFYQETYRVREVTEASIILNLRPQPFSTTVKYDGFIDCAAEYLIISGPCDLIIDEFVPVPADPIGQQDTFLHDVEDQWRTVVVDVFFEDLEPGLAGLRLSAYKDTAADELNNYERFHRESGSEPFQMILEPNTDYGDTLVSPEGKTTLQFQVFPEGYANGEICGGDTCFLGLGAASRVEFELLITTFYLEGAPEGFTLLE